jgi:hypothetical protein
MFYAQCTCPTSNMVFKAIKQREWNAPEIYTMCTSPDKFKIFSITVTLCTTFTHLISYGRRWCNIHGVCHKWDI